MYIDMLFILEKREPLLARGVNFFSCPYHQKYVYNYIIGWQYYVFVLFVQLVTCNWYWWLYIRTHVKVQINEHPLIPFINLSRILTMVAIWHARPFKQRG